MDGVKDGIEGRMLNRGRWCWCRCRVVVGGGFGVGAGRWGREGECNSRFNEKTDGPDAWKRCGVSEGGWLNKVRRCRLQEYGCSEGGGLEKEYSG